MIKNKREVYLLEFPESNDSAGYHQKWSTSSCIFCASSAAQAATHCSASPAQRSPLHPLQQHPVRVDREICATLKSLRNKASYSWRCGERTVVLRPDSSWLWFHIVHEQPLIFHSSTCKLSRRWLPASGIISSVDFFVRLIVDQLAIHSCFAPTRILTSFTDKKNQRSWHCFSRWILMSSRGYADIFRSEIGFIKFF